MDEAAVGELVERGDHVAAVDAGVPPEVRLAARPVLVERGEEPVVVSTEALGCEPGREQSLGPRVGPAQQPGRPAGDPFQRRHARSVGQIIGRTNDLAIPLGTTNDLH